MASEAFRASSLLLTVVVLASVWRGGCQTPVLFPSPMLTGVLVEDEATGKLYSVNGAIPRFYTNTTSEDPEEQCTTDLLIRTSSRKIVLWLELLDDEGSNQPLPPFGSTIDVKLEQIADVLAEPEGNTTVPEPSRKPEESGAREAPSRNQTASEEDVDLYDARGPQEIRRLEADLTLPSTAFLLDLTADINGTTRCAKVVLDTTVPAVKRLQTRPAKKGLLAGQFVKFVIDFSEKVVPIPENRGRCRRRLIEKLKNGRSIFETEEQSEACSEDLTAADLRNVIEVTNARNVTMALKKDGTRLVVEAIAEAFTKDVELIINERSFTDYAGNEVQDAITASFTPVRKLSSRVRRNRLRRRVIKLKKEKKKKKEPRGKASAQKMGKAVTAAIAATTAVTVVGAGGATQLLGSAQKTFYTGMMAVSAMPENYQGFTSELNWAGLDIDIPFSGSDSNAEGDVEPGTEEIVVLESFETSERSVAENEEQMIDPQNRRRVLNLAESGTGRRLKQLETGGQNNGTEGENEVQEEEVDEEEEEEEEEGGIADQVLAIQGILEADDEDGLAWVYRVFFWGSVIFLAILFLHASSLGLCLWKRWPVPDFCQPPRIEILFAYWAMPAIAAAASSLFRETRREALLGTWILITFPVAFLTWNIYMLYINFYGRKPSERMANMVLDEEEAPPDLEKVMKSLKLGSSKKSFNWTNSNASERASQNSRAATSSEHSGDATTAAGLDDHQEAERKGSDSEEERQGQSTEGYREQENSGERNEVKTDNGEGEEEGEGGEKLSWYRKTVQAVDVLVFTTLFGKHQPPGDWVVTKPKSTFIAQYGPIFTDHRGCPVYRKGATFEIDPESRKVNRGVLLPCKETPLLTLHGKIPFTNVTMIPGEFKLHRYHLQIVTTILDFTKGTLIACLVGGINAEDSKAQILALLLISLAMMAIIRISLPFVRRAEMVVAVLGELADIITFSLSLYLIKYADEDDEELRFRAGVTMLAAEGAAMLSLIIDRILLSLEIFEILKEQVDEMRCPHLFFKTIMTHLKSYEPYLERKYFDRWMVKALHKGLHGRSVPRVELPPLVYVKQEAEKTTRKMVGTMRGMQTGVLRRRKPSEIWARV